MTEIRFDALCIGNAICDVFAHVEEDFLLQEGLVKGSMRLIETDEAVALFNKMGQTVRISGGSAGNTAGWNCLSRGPPCLFRESRRRRTRRQLLPRHERHRCLLQHPAPS
jgi:hypothetical protein